MPVATATALRCRRDALAHDEIPHAAALSPTDIAEMIYVRVESAPASGEIYALPPSKGGRDTTSKGRGIQYRNDGGTLKVRGYFVDDAGTPLIHDIEGTLTLVVGEWYCIAHFYELATGDHNLKYAKLETPNTQSTPTVWTDVATEVTIAGPPTPFVTLKDLRFGADESSAGVVQNGANISIGEVAIYSAYVSPATLATRIGTRLDGSEAGLVLLHRLDEGEGSTSYDRHIGAGFNGTLKNKPEWTDGPLDLFYQHTGWMDTAHGFLGFYSATTSRDATLSASESATDHGVENVANALQHKTWRSTDTTGAKTITATLNAEPAVWAITLDGHNFSHDVTVTIQGPGAAEAVTFDPKTMAHMFSVPQGGTTWTLSITAGADHSGSYLELGTFHLWTCIEQQQPARFGGRTVLSRDPSPAVRTPHGSQVSRSLSRYRLVTSDWDTLSRWDAERLYQILIDVGAGAPVWLVGDAKRDLAGIYGTVAAMPTLQPTDPAHTTWSVTGLVVREDHAT